MGKTGSALMGIGMFLVIIGSDQLLLLSAGTVSMVVGLIIYTKNKKK